MEVKIHVQVVIGTEIDKGLKLVTVGRLIGAVAAEPIILVGCDPD
jgi:hypothetical protein